MKSRELHAAGDGGFTLVEVIVAMVLLGILAIAALPMFMTGLQITAGHGSATSGTAAVSSVLERARSIVETTQPAADACEHLKNYAAGVTGARDANRRTVPVMVAPIRCDGTTVTVTVTAIEPAAVCNPQQHANRCSFTATTVIYLPVPATA